MKKIILVTAILFVSIFYAGAAHADVNITSFDAIPNFSAGAVGSATYANAAAVIAALPTSATANNSAVTVPVTNWVNTDTYNPHLAGSYTFTAVLGAIPPGFTNTNNKTATIEVVVSTVWFTVTFTVTNVTIPERAAMKNLDLTTEFWVSCASNVRYEVTDASGTAVANWIDSGVSYLSKFIPSKTFDFEHFGGSYTPRIKLVPSTNGTNVPLADCQNVAGLSSYFSLGYGGTTWGNSAYATCPTPPAYSASYGLSVGVGTSAVYFNLPQITL